jgi:hypothetical protein
MWPLVLGAGMTDEDDTLAALHEELAATEELPVSREASAWLGEAQAVAGDLQDAPDEVVAERIGHVRRLLAEAGDPGNEAVAEHLERARELADRVAQRYERS